MAGADADGDAALRLHGNHAWQVCEGDAGGIGTRLDERHRYVLPFGDPELRLYQAVHRVREDQPDHEDRDGETDAGN